MSLHSPPSLGGFNNQYIDGHVKRVLMGSDYTTAQLMLEAHPVSTLPSRQGQYLRYPVKGRSLSQLQEDYENMTEGLEDGMSENLEQAYLIGWANHEPQEMLDWVSANVDTEQKRIVIYHGALAQQGKAMIDQMLGNPQHPDYSVMMMAVANTISLRNSAQTSNGSLPQIEQFFTTNQSKPANIKLLTRLATSLTDSAAAGQMLDRYYKMLNLTYYEMSTVHNTHGISSVRPLNVALAADSSNALVIPRP